MSTYLQIETTASSVAEAEQIAAQLVESRLAACVHIAGPIESVYRWQNEIERSREWACVIKTRRDRLDAVVSAIQKIHSYDCPQLIALPMEHVSEEYGRWMDAQIE